MKLIRKWIEIWVLPTSTFKMRRFPCKKSIIACISFFFFFCCRCFFFFLVHRYNVQPSVSYRPNTEIGLIHYSLNQKRNKIDVNVSILWAPCIQSRALLLYESWHFQSKLRKRRSSPSPSFRGSEGEHAGGGSSDSEALERDRVCTDSIRMCKQWQALMDRRDTKARWGLWQHPIH